MASHMRQDFQLPQSEAVVSINQGSNNNSWLHLVRIWKLHLKVARKLILKKMITSVKWENI